MGRTRRSHQQRRTKGTGRLGLIKICGQNNNDDDDEDRDLPEELLVKILTTFPIKTLFRFKCVSNRWNSIISDPYFVRLYLSPRLNSSSSLPWTLLYRDGDMLENSNKIITHDILKKIDRFYSDENNNNNNNEHASFIFSVLDFPSYVREGQEQEQQHKYTKYTVIASCIGLLLCHQVRCFPIVYYVCNPITKQWVALPRGTTSFRSFTIGLVTLVEGGVITSYKVVRICCDESRTDHSGGFRDVEIFSSEDGEWRTLKVKIPAAAVDSVSSPVSLNGILHFISYTSKEIVAYDPYNCINQSRAIKFPNYLDESVYPTPPLCDNNVMYGVCQGHLHFILKFFNGFAVWVLEDYETGKWHLEYKISSFSHYNTGLALHPFDSTILYLRQEGTIYSFNKRNKIWTTLLDLDFNNILPSSSMVLPLVLPLWPALVPKPSREKSSILMNFNRVSI